MSRTVYRLLHPWFPSKCVLVCKPTEATCKPRNEALMLSLRFASTVPELKRTLDWNVDEANYIHPDHFWSRSVNVCRASPGSFLILGDARDMRPSNHASTFSDMLAGTPAKQRTHGSRPGAFDVMLCPLVRVDDMLDASMIETCLFMQVFCWRIWWTWELRQSAQRSQSQLCCSSCHLAFEVLMSWQKRDWWWLVTGVYDFRLLSIAILVCRRAKAKRKRPT